MILIRQLMREDVDEVCELEEEAFSMPWHKESFIEMIENPDAYYLVAVLTEHNQVVGCCGMRSIVGEGDISNVVVKKEFRGQGIAKQMMHELLKAGKKEFQIESFTLEVRLSNTPAIHLYEKFGFVSEGIRKNFYDKPTEDAMIMWKR